MAEIPYERLTPEQKLRAYWDARCDADPVPDGFDEEMEAAGFITARAVTEEDVEEESFAYERGIVLGGLVWELTPEGRAVFTPSHPEGREG